MSPELTLRPLFGQILTSVEGAEVEHEEIIFDTENGRRFRMYHSQDCCESVKIYSISGDINHLIGSPITKSNEYYYNDDPEGVKLDYYRDSVTWTDFVIATEKGEVLIRWLGESNGYYSEDVSFIEIT